MCIFVWCRRSTNVTTTMCGGTLLVGSVCTRLATFVMAFCTPLPSALQPIFRRAGFVPLAVVYRVISHVPFDRDWLVGGNVPVVATRLMSGLPTPVVHSSQPAPGSTVTYRFHNENTQQMLRCSCCKKIKCYQRGNPANITNNYHVTSHYTISS